MALAGGLATVDENTLPPYTNTQRACWTARASLEVSMTLIALAVIMTVRPPLSRRSAMADLFDAIIYYYALITKYVSPYSPRRFVVQQDDKKAGLC